MPRIKLPDEESQDEKLNALPSLLRMNPQPAPDILCVSGTLHFLTGTVNIPSPTASHSLLRLADTSTRLARYLDIVIKGIKSMTGALQEGTKQSDIWREDLETCGEQQGGALSREASLTPVSADAAHADLTRLLVTGRSSPAMSDWLGNHLTSRVNRNLTQS